MNISQSFLKECLTYNPLTGDFTWNVRPRNHFISNRGCNASNARCAGKKAGCVLTNHNGKYSYVQIGISINGKTKLYKAHRLAWLYVYGEFPINGIDHIDGNSLNNSISNLRDVPQAVNCKNKRLSNRNTSGYPGVSWNSRDKAYAAYFKAGNKQHSLGYFRTAEEAAAIAAKARLENGYIDRPSN
ncbi:MULTISPECIES: HNH endonuclease signature motif containing protein [unclassified Halomonas]|uniref:HNH endonuclease signature motif containing protein n=1 Tax=unclassified Halomonas TaxID=2609666 RepID=UPI002076B27E|nr:MULTISPECIES: HNH endonuclease signature motif containing protein [unclassified Halomonas]